jgi:nitrogen fixation protein NifZ
MMIEPRPPIFEWGQAVCAAVDLYNDGSLPGAEDDVLLVAAGGPGEIVQIGHHTEANLPLYMVDFGTCVLGCFEEELVRLDEASAPTDVAGDIAAGLAGENPVAPPVANATATATTPVAGTHPALPRPGVPA